MASDRRTARTQRAVQDAFLSLLGRKRYGEITVQNILDEADVGRSTFYAHYQGKDDLLLALVEGICAHALDPIEPESEHDFTRRTDDASVVEHILRHIQERRSGVRGIITSEGAELFTRHLRHALAKRADAALPIQLPGPAAGLDRAFVVNHVAGSLVEVVIWWAAEGFVADPAHLAKQYLAVIRPTFGA